MHHLKAKENIRLTTMDDDYFDVDYKLKESACFAMSSRDIM